MDAGIVADDLTGAADCGVQFARAGYRTAVIFRGELPPEDPDAAALDTDSRALDAHTARERVLEAGAHVKSARFVYKKLDSTLRGNVAAELRAALEATGRARGIVAPAFPKAGRTTRGGVQMVHGEPVHRTEFASDPRTPVRESHIPSLLEDAGPVRVLGAGNLRVAPAVRRALEEGRWIVADAEADSDLDALVRAVPNPSEVLWAGSAGLAAALSAAYPGAGGGRKAGRAPARRVLVVAGSASGVAREQLRRLAGSGIKAIPLDSAEDALASTREALSGGGSVALHPAASEVEPGRSEEIVAGLAGVAAGLAEEGLFDALVLTGGETAARVGRQLGARGILLEGEVEPGVPVGTLIGARPYPVVTKAGGFGGPEALLDAVRLLRGETG